MIKKQKLTKSKNTKYIENKMPSLKSLILEAKQVRIYLDLGEKPPKGKKVQKGPKGGLYYMDSPGWKKLEIMILQKNLEKKLMLKI
jgi:hypothetical protein